MRGRRFGGTRGYHLNFVATKLGTVGQREPAGESFVLQEGHDAVVISLPAPMLAGAGRPVGELGEWRIEPKLDGYRAVVGVTPSDRIVRTRRGRNITEQLPDLAALCDIGVELVLDGELIAGAGRPEDFYGLAGAVASRGRSQRLTFVAFDLLQCQGVDLLPRPLHERRRLLEHVAELADGLLHIVPSYPGPDLDIILDGAEELALEGVVLKHRASAYHPGRRVATWRKMKCPDWADHAPGGSASITGAPRPIPADRRRACTTQEVRQTATIPPAGRVRVGVTPPAYGCRHGDRFDVDQPMSDIAEIRRRWGSLVDQVVAPVDESILTEVTGASAAVRERLGEPEWSELGAPANDSARVDLEWLESSVWSQRRAMPRPTTFEGLITGPLADVERRRDRDEAIAEAAGFRLSAGLRRHPWTGLIPPDVCTMRLIASEGLHKIVVGELVEAMSAAPNANQAGLCTIKLGEERWLMESVPYHLPGGVGGELLTSDPPVPSCWSGSGCRTGPCWCSLTRSASARWHRHSWRRPCTSTVQRRSPTRSRAVSSGWCCPLTPTAASSRGCSG